MSCVLRMSSEWCRYFYTGKASSWRKICLFAAIVNFLPNGSPAITSCRTSSNWQVMNNPSLSTARIPTWKPTITEFLDTTWYANWPKFTKMTPNCSSSSTTTTTSPISRNSLSPESIGPEIYPSAMIAFNLKFYRQQTSISHREEWWKGSLCSSARRSGRIASTIECAKSSRFHTS